MLNDARIALHFHHRKIPALWGKGPKNEWGENIDALKEWGYLDQDFADELHYIHKQIRNRYLHSQALGDLAADALQAANAAYRLIGMFLGFLSSMFRFANGGIECTNPADPRFIVFYKSFMVE